MPKLKSLLIKIVIGLTACASVWLVMHKHEEIKIVKLLQNADDAENDSENNQLINSSDLNKLNNLKDFEYLINHRSCKELKQRPTVVIMVHSATVNFFKRNVIRATWGSKDNSSILIFLLARVSSMELQARIEFENTRHGDLVQGNFKETYRNLTYKHIMALKWFVYNCPSSQFLLKTDDDVFINTPLLYRYLQPPTKLPSEGLIFCNEIPADLVIRYPCKWQVTKEEYENDFYPARCPGFSILYSADVVRELYFKAQSLPFFWIDDVFITGEARSKINVNITDPGSLQLTGENQNQILSGEVQLENVPPFLFGGLMCVSDIKIFWKMVCASLVEK